MKLLIQETGQLITRLSNGGGESQPGDTISVDFEFCEEVASRFLWCRPSKNPSSESRDDEDEPMGDKLADKIVSIPSPSNPGASYIDLPFSTLAEPVEKVLLAEGVADRDLDDEEKPISLLAYNTLLSLPPDVRSLCMSRIVFIGGGANIPGVRRRILDEVARLVEQYGWSLTRGKVIDEQIQKLLNLKLSRQSTPTPPEPSQEQARAGSENENENENEAADEPEVEIDPIEQKLSRNKGKDLVPPVQGTLREVETLGPWAGASLVTSLKIRGLVEIEREKYLQQGLLGASRDLDYAHSHREVHSLGVGSGIPDRRSGLRTGGDRSSWTLAGWG
jgi:hypothetical protein